MKLGRFYWWHDLHVWQSVPVLPRGLRLVGRLVLSKPSIPGLFHHPLHLLDSIAELVSLMGPSSDRIHLNNWEPVPLNPAQLCPTMLALLVQILRSSVLVSQPRSPCEWFKISADLQLVLSGWCDCLLLTVCVCHEKKSYMHIYLAWSPIVWEAKAYLESHKHLCITISHTWRQPLDRRTFMIAFLG